MARELTPATFEDAAAALAAATAEGHHVRIVGGGTKIRWGNPIPDPNLVLRTTGLDRVLEHNVGDFICVLQAGVPIARAQERFAAEGQMLALDPPLGTGANGNATVGGVFATADSGPLRHRYGAPRDLILGVTVALSDGTIAHAGGKVIKNVAGYDLAKLLTGSFGTLGVLLSVSVRLHPLPITNATALGASTDPDALALAARALARAPLELEALDVAWRAGRGGLLARSAGVEARRRSQRVAELMREAGLEQVEVVEDDAGLWARQRAGQRSERAVLLRVSARPTLLAHVLRATEEVGATLVGRAALGASYVEVQPEALQQLRAALPAHATTVTLDAPSPTPDAWGAHEGPALALMRRVKQRFDPSATCNPGVFVGGI